MVAPIPRTLRRSGRFRIASALLLLVATGVVLFVETADARSRSNCRKRPGRYCPSLGAGGGGGPDGPPPFQAELPTVDTSFMAPGEQRTIRLAITNTGTETWGPEVTLRTPDGTAIRHASGGTTDSSNTRVAFVSEFYGDPYVTRGDVAVFTYTVTAPVDEAHAFNQRLILRRDPSPDSPFQDVTVIGAEFPVPMVYADGDHFPPELTAADCTWEHVDQWASPVEDGGAVVADGAPAQAGFRIRNTSKLCPWFPDGVAPLRLGTSKPNDRVSKFAQIGDGWLSNNRLAMSAPVPPGGTAIGEFTFGLEAAADVPQGTYDEGFHPVVEGRFHLAEREMFMRVHRR